MKLIESSKYIGSDQGKYFFELDKKHLLSIQRVGQKVYRVTILKNKIWRLDKTWSVAFGQEDIPFQGLDRELLPNYKDGKYKDSKISFSNCEILVESNPLRIKWNYKGKNLFEDRPTGAYYINTEGHRHQHFIHHNEGTKYFGMGEKSGHLDRTGRTFENKNLDAMGYDAETTDPLYKHIPFYIGKTQENSYGIFHDNFSISRYKFLSEIDNYHRPYVSYEANDGDIDYYVIVGREIKDITETFSWLTGKTFFGPRWSLGYSGSTMSYTDSSNAQDRMNEFLENIEEKNVLCNSFQLSSGYTSIGEKRYVFNWNRDKFPAPGKFVSNYLEKNINICANVKPVLLRDHPKYDEAKEYFIKDSEYNVPQISIFWDDWGSHIDFTNPDARSWWKKNLKENLFDFGIHSVWNDNNEYEIWDENARNHQGVPHSLTRPVQTLLMAKTSLQAQKKNQPKQRPWGISRAGMPGMQRYVQTWSGDNTTDWKTLKFNLYMGLSMSLSGVYNVGHDVGGFAGPKPEPELLLRWIQQGIFHPRFTIHSWNSDNTVTEPWMYDEILPLVQEAINFRYQLMPYLYNLLYKAHKDFTPIIAPTFYYFEEDSKTFLENTEFMLGENLLVATVLEKDASTRILYLPESETGWVDFHTGDFFEGAQEVSVNVTPSSIPLFAKGGSIIPLGEANQRAALDGGDKRILCLFPGVKDFRSNFNLFEDDGISYGHQEDKFKMFEFDFSGDKDKLTLNYSTRGDFETLYPGFEIKLPSNEKRKLFVNGNVWTGDLV